MEIVQPTQEQQLQLTKEFYLNQTKIKIPQEIQIKIQKAQSTKEVYRLIKPLLGDSTEFGEK